jgi:hypothetical protein
MSESLSSKKGHLYVNIYCQYANFDSIHDDVRIHIEGLNNNRSRVAQSV